MRSWSCPAPDPCATPRESRQESTWNELPAPPPPRRNVRNGFWLPSGLQPSGRSVRFPLLIRRFRVRIPGGAPPLTWASSSYCRCGLQRSGVTAGAPLLQAVRESGHPARGGGEALTAGSQGVVGFTPPVAPSASSRARTKLRKVPKVTNSGRLPALESGSRSPWQGPWWGQHPALWPGRATTTRCHPIPAADPCRRSEAPLPTGRGRTTFQAKRMMEGADDEAVDGERHERSWSRRTGRGTGPRRSRRSRRTMAPTRTWPRMPLPSGPVRSGIL